MLVGQSTAEYILIKTIIYFFSYLGLLCILYFYLALSIGGVRVIAHPVSIFIESIGAIEILWYLVWFLPYRRYLHKQRAAFPPRLSRYERQRLFRKSLETTADIELFTRKWMGGAHLDDIRRENIKEWMLWALFNREGSPAEDDEELEAYLFEIEEKLGWAVKPGWGPAKSLRLNFDRFEVTHRSLIYYLFVGCVDFATTIILMISGFRFYRQPRSAFLKSFPLRPMTLLAPKQSVTPSISYFFRQHKSTKHRPVVLAHGVGIGLAPYVPLLLQIPKDIGVLAIEIIPISSRITTALPHAADLMREIGDIISHHKLDDFVFVGHSYGTFLTSLFLKSSLLESRMHSIILLDPVAVLLHLPDMAYNFTRRKPVEANELQLWWAAQTEPDIAFTLGRRFCWREHIVWREDLLSRTTTVIMGGRDTLVNADAIASYITRGDLAWTWEDREDWRRSRYSWTGQGLELVWLEGYDHGQSFLSRVFLPMIVKTIEKHAVLESRLESPLPPLPEPDAKLDTTE
ncbi:uncharacterized protein BDR25DRAFT_251793 [Lindgomyces ingoldianus]|uniref:Uncharacterized protein n=1 Tax=Lindgomyces ingoldianus TaxID=673940 RepID=A0ACB6RDH3_9PLEO|nr:uncharacterized protein BDR25DRAFT_251793 [Lindgomyces ingoldianus]KAF2477191.1 hypothetical protein BDR25DRAFT_251793 [Lindgomyces ingoldianus]